ncbi:hypothetical protein LguiA_012651 [Lonicera macranthoides]
MIDHGVHCQHQRFWIQSIVHNSVITFRSRLRFSQLNPLRYNCTNLRGNYTSDSVYRSNLDAALSTIRLIANSSVYGFYNSSVGQGIDTVSALALCRGDVERDACAECVRNATFTLRELCPVQKIAIVWYDNCMLRYSNRSIFHTMANGPCFAKRNPQTVVNVAQFNDDLRTLVDALRTRAAGGGSLRKFATGNISGPDFLTIYGLVQCTPDISEEDCNRCLISVARAVPGCCNGRRSGRVVCPSCSVRFEEYSYYTMTEYDASPPEPAPLLPPPPPSVTENPRGGGKSSSTTVTAIATTSGGLVLLLALGFCYAIRKINKKKQKKYDTVADENDGDEIITIQSLQFDLGTIKSATNNFADDNKIGQGGFGMVYKGTLADGQEIAVKRLSKSLGQGALEFKNEVVLLAKLHHRHLVRLLGFCLEEQEKILVYEYFPNKSLDYFLFDPEMRGQLDWSRRYKIIAGIAKGILYLHEDSRLRIIHRDLKASNILLDMEMNAKVSDFGLAKLFEVDQTHGNTNRIVGTRGCMSPEYVMHGLFSVKSDVFSFGILVLEIISGKRNSNFYRPEHAVDLISYAWELWRDERALELMDPCLKDSFSRNEVIRCIHMGLLCVQEKVDVRPTMETIVLMLSSYSISLPSPQKPPFFIQSRIESDQLTSNSVEVSVSSDDSLITDVYPR